MATHRISIGTAERLTQLFSYKNDPKSSGSLPDTILYWFNMTLTRDGFVEAKASVDATSDNYWLELEGPDEELADYGSRLSAFLTDGWEAHHVAQELKTKEKTWPEGELSDGTWWKAKQNTVWDPMETGEWRFFLPLGMALLRQRTLQFFHYPPSRLLYPMRDYLNDPVPARLIELQMANGVKTRQECMLLNTVMDCAPIAAPDDQGTIYLKNREDPVHLLPIEDFHEYQRSQVRTLLNPHGDAYTVPIVCYGTPARQTFSDLYLKGQEPLGSSLDTRIVEIINGRKTPVLGIEHPYAFYAQAQISDTTNVGCGHIVNPEGLEKMMIQDLAAARWQCQMADDPTQSPSAVAQDAIRYWNDPARADEVCALVRHEGSLYYPDKSLRYSFKVLLPEAADICRNKGNSIT